MLWLETELGGQGRGPPAETGWGWKAGRQTLLGDGKEAAGRHGTGGGSPPWQTTGRFFINIGSVYKATRVEKHLPNRDFFFLIVLVSASTTNQMPGKGLLCAPQAPPRPPAVLSLAPCTSMSLAVTQRKAVIPRLQPRRPINQAGQ